MKAFKIELETKQPLDSYCCWGTAEHFWKAALEWVLKTAKELDEQDAPIDMGDVLEKELKDE